MLKISRGGRFVCGGPRKFQPLFIDFIKFSWSLSSRFIIAILAMATRRRLTCCDTTHEYVLKNDRVIMILFRNQRSRKFTSSLISNFTRVDFEFYELVNFEFNELSSLISKSTSKFSRIDDP